VNKRQLKKNLSAFGYTIKDGEVKGKLIPRWPAEHYLNRNHPLVVRYWDRIANEQARVLPSVIKAKIDRVSKSEFIRRVNEHEPMTLPKWSEQGGKPRQRLYSVARHFIEGVDWKGLTYVQGSAIENAQFSALFKSRPQVIGNRTQSGNRLCQ